MAEFGFLLAGCGGIFQAPSGEIHSPNYPNSYRANTQCSWIIQVGKHHRVLLNITDFDLEATDSCIMVRGTNCKHCYLLQCEQILRVYLSVMGVFRVGP